MSPGLARWCVFSRSSVLGECVFESHIVDWRETLNLRCPDLIVRHAEGRFTS